MSPSEHCAVYECVNPDCPAVGETWEWEPDDDPPAVSPAWCPTCDHRGQLLTQREIREARL